MVRPIRIAGLLGGLLLAAGCGGDPGLVPVNGRVTLEGKPVREVIVNFQPTGDTRGTGALGNTDADGRFTLTDSRGKAGAYVGAYKVIFYPALPAGIKEGEPADVVGAAFGKTLPGIYLDVSRTPLEATVPPGGGTVDILLTKSGKGAATKTTPGTPGG